MLHILGLRVTHVLTKLLGTYIILLNMSKKVSLSSSKVSKVASSLGTESNRLS